MKGIGGRRGGEGIRPAKKGREEEGGGDGGEGLGGGMGRGRGEGLAS